MNNEQKQWLHSARYAAIDAITALEEILDIQDDPDQGVDSLLRDATSDALFAHIAVLQRTHKYLTELIKRYDDKVFVGAHVTPIKKCVMAVYYE